MLKRNGMEELGGKTEINNNIHFSSHDPLKSRIARLEDTNRSKDEKLAEMETEALQILQLRTQLEQVTVSRGREGRGGWEGRREGERENERYVYMLIIHVLI